MDKQTVKHQSQLVTSMLYNDTVIGSTDFCSMASWSVKVTGWNLDILCWPIYKLQGIIRPNSLFWMHACSRVLYIVGVNRALRPTSSWMRHFTTQLMPFSNVHDNVQLATSAASGQWLSASVLMLLLLLLNLHDALVFIQSEVTNLQHCLGRLSRMQFACVGL